jgi:hypothetical protein
MPALVFVAFLLILIGIANITIPLQNKCLDRERLGHYLASCVSFVSAISLSMVINW